MINKEIDFDTCHIESRIVEDGRDPGHAGSRQIWLRFIAIGSDGRVYGRSDIIPMVSMMGSAAYEPQKNNIAHTNIFNNFVEQLLAAGWQLEPVKGGQWWQKRLRRPRSDNGRRYNKFSRAV